MKTRMMGLAAAAAVFAAGGAWAVSAVVTGSAYGSSKLDACSAAKDDARAQATLDAMKRGLNSNPAITRFGDCQCEEGSQGWRCTVDAHYESN